MDDSHVDIEVDEELAALQAEAEARRAAEAAAHAAARPAHVVVPELTEGKTHHLFISHAEEDSDWASQLVKTLEDDKGLTCRWYKRDFKPGRTVLESIQEAMLTCMKVLFIITPDFLASNWCQKEVDWATGMSVGERKCLVIPLLLKNCDLPLVLNNFLYIDVPKGQDHVERIVRSFDPDDDNQRMVPSTVEFIPQTGSGLSSCIDARKNFDSRFRGTKWSFRKLDQYQARAFNKMGSEFAADMHNRAREIVNASSYMRYYSLGMISLQGILFLLSVMALTSLVTVLIGVVILYTTKDFSYTNYLHIIHWPAFILVPILTSVMSGRSFSKVRRAVWRLSLNHFKNTNILLDVRSSQIRVMYYNVNPCLDYLTETIFKKRARQMINHEGLKAQARIDAYEMIIKYLEDNMENFMLWSSSRVSTTKRHQTYLNKICLCERIV